jgi:hypothetical protein
VMIIIQPKIFHESQYTMTVAALREFIDRRVRKPVESGRINPVYVPTSDNCHYCKGRKTCAARTAAVMDAVTDIVTPLADLYAKVGLVTDWAKDICEMVKDALTAGEQVTRSDGLCYKLVHGKKGSRTWTDEGVAAAAFIEMGLKTVAFTQSVISPAVAEKLVKVRKARGGKPTEPAPIGPVQWTALQALMVTGEASTAIALSTDKRPALGDDFEVLTDTAEPVVDYFI